jgi:predicted lactoylglutathione lyase
MLLTQERFADFSRKPLADPATHTQALFAFTTDSRDAVDALADTALRVGGSPAGEPQDHGFMYSRSFRDPDGHHFEVFWMDTEAAEEGPHAAGGA